MDSKIRSRNRMRIYKNQKKEKLVTVISSAIGNTIRYSLDQEFRQKCFKLLKVNNTVDCQEAIKEKLMLSPKTSFPAAVQSSKEDSDVRGDAIILARDIGNDYLTNYESNMISGKDDLFSSIDHELDNPDHLEISDRNEIEHEEFRCIQNKPASLGTLCHNSEHVILDKTCFVWNDDGERAVMSWMADTYL